MNTGQSTTKKEDKKPLEPESIKEIADRGEHRIANQ